jgi:hypothetical protein
MAAINGSCDVEDDLNPEHSDSSGAENRVRWGTLFAADADIPHRNPRPCRTASADPMFASKAESAAGSADIKGICFKPRSHNLKVIHARWNGAL